MAEKKYQFFISSTYEDLKEERNRLFWAVLKKKHIPIGMELFGAVDEEQMIYIKRLIDDCDCYVILLGGRYGSVNKDGISYTEQEYEYAVSKGLKIIALVHKDPESLPPEKRDNSEELRKKFMVFRKKVLGANRLAAQWENLTDLVENFHISIDETIKNIPMVGWVRGDTINPETLQRVAFLEAENRRLQESINLSGGIQIAKDLQMEARSATSPSLDFGTEIECVSLVITPNMESNIDPSLLITHDPKHPSGEIAQYYCEEAIPWFVRMARICCFDLKITNPYPFPIESLGAEAHFFNSEGKEIAFTNPVIFDAPPHPLYGLKGHIFGPSMGISCLNPKQVITYKQHCFHVPKNDDFLVYQKVFTAKNIVEPIEKRINIHFRIKTINMDYNQMIKIIQVLERVSKFNDVGVFEFVRNVLVKEGKEQDSCDTQK